tara:strand:+ start:242 stop:460 length:219 start_codon:yes stop_codon:yes gene_type:complete
MTWSRSEIRERKLNDKPLYILEAELWELTQSSKLNKDARNRKTRLERIIAIKQFAAQKVREKVNAQLEKEKK